MKTIEALAEDPDLVGMRLDVFISERLGLFSRSQTKARIAEARVNGKSVRLSHRLAQGDRVSVDYTDAPVTDLLPEEIPLAILFENGDVIVLDKPQGMVVHPGSGNPGGTLVNALLFHCGGLRKEFAEDLRPGIVHRLDKETSGVIIAAKNPRAHEFLSAQFKARQTRKRYVAIAKGRPEALQGRVETRIVRDPSQRTRFVASESRGRTAVTSYKVIRLYAPSGTAAPFAAMGRGGGDLYSFVSLFPHTGRTHQLRVHMRFLSAPILGDTLYGKTDPRFSNATLMLHAHKLSIVLPGERDPREFTAPLPERFRLVLKKLQSLSLK